VALAAVVLVAVSYGLSQLILRAKHPYGDAAQKKPADQATNLGQSSRD